MADKVTVACKLPFGLLLDLRGPIEIVEINGQKSASATILAKVTLRGSAEQRRLESDGNLTGETQLVIDGYGLTQVSAEFWTAWEKQNAGSALLMNKVVFAMPKLDLAKDKAREISPSVETGLEPINPLGDRRMKGRTPNGQAVDVTKADSAP